MNNAVKIVTLTVTNFKRVRAVEMALSENGLTTIGGRNGQGKTTVLDAIAYALGGDRFRPSNPQNDWSDKPPRISVTLSNGLVVERNGKNGTLKVTDPDGKKSGQQLLNGFVEALALDLPRFLQASGKEKAATLLKIIGVGDKLHEMERQEKDLYDERTLVGRDARKKRQYADGLPTWPDVTKRVNPSDLIAKQRAILERNAENKRKRDELRNIEQARDATAKRVEDIKAQIASLEAYREREQKNLDKLEAELKEARDTASGLFDESTAPIEQELRYVEAINAKVADNERAREAAVEADKLEAQYDFLTATLEAVREGKKKLLDGAHLPLPGLSVTEGELTYNGAQWDCMSGAEQLVVATAIVRAINPKCGFVLLDKLEQMDKDTLAEFGAWLEKEDLQVIATRVSTGDECSIIIEDGEATPTKARVLRTEPKGNGNG